MSHVMFGGLTHDPAIDLAKTRVQISAPALDKVFFADSGSVSVEVALKMALQYWHNQGQAQKNRFITPLGGYHGDTFGAMSVCDPDNGMHHLFSSMLPKQYFVTQPKLDNTDEAIASLENTLSEHHQSIAALILEPIVQGAGGMNIYMPEYLSAARTLCDEFGVLLILDEIATGFGRTGTLFAYEQADVVPDILCLGKALTGGYMSLAATLTSAQVATTVGTLMHGPTFMANPLACRVASASIALLLESNWQQQVQDIETVFTQELSALKDAKGVADVRIKGAIAVLELTDPIAMEATQKRLLECGVWLRPYGKLLYAMPPFIIDQAQLLALTDAMKTIVREL